MARTIKQEPMVKKTCDPRKSHVPINQLKIDTPRRMKATNLFACAGINQYYLGDIGVDVVLTNEIKPPIAHLNHAIYPNSIMVIGDITSPKVQDKLAEIANREKCEILLCSPKCQQVTRANTRRDPDSDELLLFTYAFAHLDRCPYYNYVAIENAEEYLNFKVKKLGDIPLGEYIENEFRKRGFKYVYKKVQNAKYFGTAMNRDRTIIIASRVKPVKLPEPLTPIPLTAEDVMDDLPTLEFGQRGPDWYDAPRYVAPWQLDQIKSTPTGYKVHNPLNLSKQLSGTKHDSSWCRAEWNKPIHSVLTNSGELSAYHMIHPGRLICDKYGKAILDDKDRYQFTDCRTFTIHELFRALRLPDDIQIPLWARPKHKLLRTCIGECFAPMHCAAVVAEFVKAEFNLNTETKRENHE